MMMFRPNKSTSVETLFDEIQSDVHETFELLGPQIQDDWQDLISVDVEYSGATVTVRSKPGEPPRRETGDLYESIQEETETDYGSVSLEISTDIEYAPYLEDGTEKMAPRPHRTRTFEKWVDEVIDATLEAVQRPSR